MEDVLPPWSSLATFTGLAALVVLSLVRGWLIPRSTVDKIIEQKDRAIDDRDTIIRELRAQNAATDQRNDLLASQVHHLVSSGYAAPLPIRAIATTQTYQGDDPDAGVHGVADSGGQTSPSPRGSQTRRNGKARRGGAGRR